MANKPKKEGRPISNKAGNKTGKKPGGKPDSRRSDGPARLWLYGRHTVAAALTNPERQVRRVLATKNAADWLADRGGLLGEIDPQQFEDTKPDAIDRALPTGAVHQGLAAEVFDLPPIHLKEACAPDAAARPVVILDQITDPQNIGAIFRSAAAFGARAVVVQDRRTPPLSGVLAKAAAGAIETVPCVPVVNIARAIEALQGLGYFCVGLAGEADQSITDAPKEMPVALVLGAEGAGLRQLVAATCDALVRIPIAPAMESLNVSTAAAVALYELTRK